MPGVLAHLILRCPQSTGYHHCSMGEAIASKCLSMCVCSAAKSYPTLGDPIDCSPPGKFVHGILQARILEWVSISFSRGSSPPRDQSHVLWHRQADSLPLNHLGSPKSLSDPPKATEIKSEKN